MSQQATIGELFDLAIRAEEATEVIYRGLEAKFVHQPEVAAFWSDYAADEAKHAHTLECIRDTLGQERLSAPAPPKTLEDARKAAYFPVARVLRDVRDLEQAYQLAHQLENSETNAIFEILVRDFSIAQQNCLFLVAQLNDHIFKILVGFPDRFRGAAARLGVMALS